MVKSSDPNAKKKRSSAERLFARYKTYEGERGSPEQWRAQAQALAVNFGSANHLTLLGLQHIPSSLDELKVARRKAMLTAHPDRGGNADDAARINAAYSALEYLVHRPTVDKGSVTPAGLVDPPRCTGELPSDPDHSDFVAELKMDGSRFMLYIGFDPYGRNRLANTLLSRHKSRGDGRYMDRSGNVPHITQQKFASQDRTILDGEVFLQDLATTQSIMGSSESEAADKQKTLGKVQFWAFDVVFHQGRDVRQLPRRERRLLLESIVAELGCSHIRLMPQWKGNTKAQFAEVTEKGGEGLVIKDERLSYGSGWAKMKKSYDVSCIVTGYKPGQKALEGMVGSLAISVYDAHGALVEVGFVAGFTSEVIRDMTANFDRYLGHVVDVFCHELTKDGRLRSPTFHRFRDDVNADECTVKKLQSDMTKTRSHRSKS